MTDKKTFAHGPFQTYFPSAVQKGQMVTLSGHVSVDAEGQPKGSGDLVAQTRNVYAGIAETLAGMGLTMDDVVDETYFVTDAADLMQKIEPLWAARSEAYGAEQPKVTQTCVQVAALVMPELLIEIRCVAVA